MDPSSNFIANKTTETSTTWITKGTSIYIYLETRSSWGVPRNLTDDVCHSRGCTQNLQNKIMSVKYTVNNQPTRLSICLEDLFVPSFPNFPTSDDKKKPSRPSSMKVKPIMNVIGEKT